MNLASATKWLLCGPALLTLLLCGCHSYVDPLIDKTKSQAKAADIKAAALPLFALTNVSATNLPKQITSLPLFNNDPDIQSWFMQTNILVLSTGGGFGHWGLVICQDQI